MSPVARVEIPSHGDCFVCSRKENPLFGIVFYAVPEQKKIFARFAFKKEHQGPPGYAHGGSIAAVLDEIMGVATGFFVTLSLAARLEVTYKRPVPLEEEVTIEAFVTRKRGRKVYAQSEILLKDGKVAAQSRGLYIRPLFFERFFLARQGEKKDASV